MAKTRLQIPKAIRDTVLKEFNHRCAICGTDRPQVHHIDENPSNNDPLNLIPLCPNCHLVDQHNPTIPIDSEKLRLFREFKDPTILKPQFHPLFTRIKFLNSVKVDSNTQDLYRRSHELVEFIANLEMGSFYSKRIGELVGKPISIGVFFGGETDKVREERIESDYRKQLCSAKDQVYWLVIELLRFQKW